MPFFNFRRGGQSPANTAPASQPESVEVIRKRARHRLIGAAVLVLAGVVGFPLLFDTQPRPVAIDIPIEIPGKNIVKPLALPAASAPAVAAVTPPPATPTPAASAPRVAPASSLAAREEIVPDKPATPPVAAVVPPKPAASVAKPPVVAAVKPEPKPETPKPAAAKPSSTDDAARARALLEGKPVAATPAPTAADEGRMIVQVGAYSDVTKAREARLKLERAGLKTYTQVTETKDGKRIRVRVGPFATRAEAEKAASKIKGLDLPAAILTL